MPQSVLDSVTTVRESSVSRRTLSLLGVLTPVVLFIHGYHPFADDASIYVAGIRKLLNPGLFRPDAAFVSANTRLSLFADLLAAIVRITHLPLTVVLLAAHLVSIYLFLLAGWIVATRLFTRANERWFAVAFSAACFTLPAAGTALAVMDPYVTSRSFSTPLGIFAVAAVLDRKLGVAALFVVLTGLMHPLMVIYTAALVLLYAILDSGHARAAILLAMAAVASVGVLAFALRGTATSAAYVEAIHNHIRIYLFPNLWTWYEDFGLIAPLALLGLAAHRSKQESRARKLCIACVLLGASAILAAFLFVHSSGPYLLARLQFLRSFQIIYALGVLALGGWLGKAFGERQSTRLLAFALLAVAAAGLFAAQRATYPFSAHVEWPGEHPRNPWAQAYWWIRANTPRDAVFAADPKLIFLQGVDSQGFRATTRRSILTDDKDQGVAAVVDPSLAPEWFEQRNAQLGLNEMSDQQRITKLSPFGVNWLLLRSDSATDFPCPYSNATAKVCRMEELRAQRPSASAPLR